MNETAKSRSAPPVSDEELVRQAKDGDEDALTALVVRYAALVRRRAMGFAKGTLDADDLYQEGMIALLSAVRGFREGAGGTFRTFAAACVNNKLRSAVISHMRDKNAPMRAYLSLSDAQGEEERLLVSADDPEQMVIAGEETDARRREIETLLSPFERQVLKCYLSAYSYDEMAKRLGSTTKAVDNALQRVRRKLRKSFASA